MAAHGETAESMEGGLTEPALLDKAGEKLGTCCLVGVAEPI